MRREPRSITSSFPLDRARRLRRHVVDDAIDALDLIDDAGRGAAEEGHVVGVEVGGHAVDRSYSPERADEIIRPPVAHDAHRLHRQKHRERLPDLVIEPALRISSR